MTINKLFVFGCSYATGEELLLHELGELDNYRITTATDPRKFFKRLEKLKLQDQYVEIKKRQKDIAWPKILADKLGYNCVNLAESGNSLDKMLFQIYQELHKCAISENDLIIVSITKSTRNAIFDKTVESFQLPSLYWPVKSIMGTTDSGDIKPVINKKADQALLEWFTDDRVCWDFVKNLQVLQTIKNLHMIPAMSNELKTSMPVLIKIYESCNFLTTKSLDDFTNHRMAWGHPDAAAHIKYSDHLYEILR
jgi:hypothetical protein